MTAKREPIEYFIQQLQTHWPSIANSLSPALIRIHRLHDYLQQELEQVLAPYALQKADFSVLSTLRRSGPPYCLSPTELTQSMLLSSGGLTKVLNRVAAAQLIARIENMEDKRSKLVQLTEQGLQLVEEIMPKLHHTEQANQVHMTPQERQQLDQLLAKWLQHWE